MQTHIFYLFVILGISITSIRGVAGSCPSANTTLTKWSSVSAWNTVGAQVNITANQKILMDVSPPQISYINIFGVLYITDASNINVTTKYISVYAGGQLIVGTPDCPITKKVIVSFYGPRSNHSQMDMGYDAFDSVGMGSKGLSVRTNGTFIVNGWYEGPAWTNLAQIANATQTTIVLREPVFWQPGDQIVLTSTDYAANQVNPIYPSISWWIKGNGDPEQTEMATIKSVSGNVITLTAPLNYTHWAGHYQYAEVGLLTRRVVFQGAPDSDPVEFGGHVMLRKAQQIQIIGAEFYRMGQKGMLGRYPIHFHFIHNASGLGYLVQQCSSHHNYFRSLTIHETYGVTVRDVVAYLTNGHMFFLEEGGEHNNTFDHNLGAVTLPIPTELMNYGINMSVIPTDNEPSVFWITNPDNIFTNNAAVGGKFGFWVTLPAFPIGESAKFWAIQNPNYQPYHLQLALFYNNTAHSNAVHCINIDRGISADGTAPGGDVNPGGNPYWGNNNIVFQKSTAYKCRGSGVWSITALQHSGGAIIDTGFKGVFFNGDASYHDAVFVGSSANVGIVPWQRKQCGLSTYDVGGDQNSYNNIFINFTTNYNGYIGGAQCGQGSDIQPICMTYNNTYINANPYTMSSINHLQGAFVWNDLDGTATGIANGAYVISSGQSIALPVHATCSYNTTIPNSYVCNRQDGLWFIRAAFVDPTTFQSYTSYSDTLLNGTVTAPMPRNVIRYKVIDAQDNTRYGVTIGCSHGLPCVVNNYAVPCDAIMTNMPPRRMIIIQFIHNTDYRATPSQYRLQFDQVSPGDWMFVGVPYPTTATFAVSDANTGAPFTQVYSFAAVNLTTFYYDSSTELLWTFLKAASTKTRVVQGVSYNVGATNMVNIQATCVNNLCQPTLSKLQSAYPAHPRPFVENVYFATLQNSQVVPATAAKTGQGLVQIWHYPVWNEIHVAVLHDLPKYNPTTQIGIGAFGSSGSLLSFPLPPSLAKAVFATTPALMSALYTGNLFVQIGTTVYPQGQTRAQLYCNGTCTQPVIYKETNVCTPPSGTAYIFNNGVLSPGWTAGVYNLSQENFGMSSSSLCGNASLSATFGYGQYQLTGTLEVNPSFTYLEFYVKTAYGLGVINPGIWLRTNLTNSPTLRMQPYALDKQLDDADGFQLVSIPISAFQIGNTFRLRTLIFTNGGTQVTINLDQIRFVTKPAAFYNYGASLKAGVSPFATPSTTGVTPTSTPSASGGAAKDTSQSLISAADNITHNTCFTILMIVFLAINLVF